MADELTFDAIYATQAFASLLECELATFGQLCMRKRTPTSDLRRHRAIITDSFMHMVTLLERMRKETLHSGRQYHPKYALTGRVQNLLSECESVDPSFVIARYLTHIEQLEKQG